MASESLLVPVPTGGMTAWATMPDGSRAFLAFESADAVTAWAAKQAAHQDTRPLPVPVVFGLARAAGASQVVVDPLGPRPSAIDRSKFDRFAGEVTFDPPAHADREWMNVPLRIGIALMASRPGLDTRQWFYDRLRATRIFLARDPRTDTFTTPAYQGASGKVVMAAFSDPAAVIAWIASWSRDPLVYGSMPVRAFVTGLRRSKPPADVVVLNYGLRPELILEGQELDSLAH